MTKPTTQQPKKDADRKAPPLPNCHEVLRRCRAERLGHRFAENMF